MAANAPYKTIEVNQLRQHHSDRVIVEAARSLLSYPVDSAIQSILKVLGNKCAADRAWMFEYDDELLTFRNTHEWVRDGITAYVQDLQDAPVTMFAWLHKHLIAGRAVLVRRVEGLPRVASSLRQEMLRQDDKSILAVPVFFNGKLRAAFGLDAVVRYKSWSAAEVSLFFQVAPLIAAARYRQEKPAANNGAKPPLIYLKNARGVRGVELRSIVCVRSNRNSTSIILNSGQSFDDVRPFGIWATLLPPATFVKVHRTAIVNLSKVRSIEANGKGSVVVQLENALNIPVARSCRKELKQRIGI